MIHQLGGVLALLIAILAAFIFSLMFLVDLLITIVEHLTNQHNRRSQKRNKED